MHVALAVVAMASSNALYLNKHISFGYLVWLFSATLLYYNALKYFRPLRTKQMRSKRFRTALVLITLVAALLCLCLFWTFSATQYALLGIALVLGASYALSPNALFSRENGLLKILTVALVWAIVTVLMPNNSWSELDTTIWLQFVATIFWVLALMIPFELKDAALDRLTYKTIVQQIGPIKSHYLAQLFLTLWFTGMLALPLCLEQYLALISTYLISLVFIRRAMLKTQDFFVVFWVEALPVLGLATYAGFYLWLK
jgi:hypothetical protein